MDKPTPENAFGFSLVSEEELTEPIKNTSDKLIGLKDMIMPLLKNLTNNPEKEYLYWPNRVEKVKEFISKIEKYLEE